MRAIAVDRLGAPGEAGPARVAMPRVEPGELLVRVAAVGVNPADWKALMGWLPFVDTTMPLVTGFDGVGTVVAIGEGAAGFAVGDRIGFMSAIAMGRGGSFAEYAVCRPDHAALIPAGVSMAAAATVPVAGVSAREALVSVAALTGDERILVNGGSGGTGLWAIQIACALGARVAATAGPDNQDLLRAFGVECAIDYRNESIADRIAAWAPGGVDLLLDTVGQGSLAHPAGLIRSGGRYLAIETMLPDEARVEALALAEKGISAQRVSASWERLGVHLSALYGALAAADMRALPLEQLPAARAGEALERVRGGHVRGKIVLSLAHEADWRSEP